MGRTSNARERLLEAAHRLVWERGYGAAGVDSICEAAGVAKGSFYHFFDSKADLVKEAIDARCESDRAGLDSLFSPSRPPLERLWRWFRAIEETQRALRGASGRTLGCPLGAVGAELAAVEQELAACIDAHMARNARYVETAIRDAQAEGAVRADINARELAAGLFTYLDGVMLRARIRDDPAVAAPLEAGARLILGLPSRVEPGKGGGPRRRR